MGSFINIVKSKLKESDTLFILIFINVFVFLVIALLRLIAFLFQFTYPSVGIYFEVSSIISVAFTHIWTLITYAFIHYDILHILFNMLILYGFGRIFMLYFTPKQLVAVYILGAISGAIFYILCYNTIPYFIGLGPSFMIGASASVMAVIFASAFYNKDMSVSLLFIGSVKIIYIAIVILLIDCLALGNGVNAGGHLAHIGGALFGIFYANRYKKGVDITKWFNVLLDKVFNLFKKSPKMRVSHQKSKSDQDYNKEKSNNQDELDRILDKIKESGYNSLSVDDKKKLFDASNK